MAAQTHSVIAIRPCRLLQSTPVHLYLCPFIYPSVRPSITKFYFYFLLFRRLLESFELSFNVQILQICLLRPDFCHKSALSGSENNPPRSEISPSDFKIALQLCLLVHVIECNLYLVIESN